MHMKTWLVIGLGGALGSMARHGVGIVVSRTMGTVVPHATAIVNVVGCFVIGALAGAVAGGFLHLGQTSRALIFVGVLGGFTTFSSLGLDTLTLVRGGALSTAVVNVAIQFGAGISAVFLGFWMARSIGH
jgi:CrcB protein